MSDETKQGGGWAVAYRVKATQEAFFHDDAEDDRRVDETTARKVFGRCIRAGELGLQVEGVEIDAVRLLRWDPVGCHLVTVQQADTDYLDRWTGATSGNPVEPAPYHDEFVPPGVPCIPGAWGSDTSCAMHSGFDLDENGLCVEGRRAVKVLDLIVIPAASSMRKVWGFPATMTREELDEVFAFAAAELVHRGKGETLTDEQLNRAVEVLERKASES